MIEESEREKNRISSYNYYQKHKERILKNQRIRWINNKIKFRERSRKYYYKNKEYIKSEILKFFNNKCNRCGFSDERALQIDHINGDGVKDRTIDIVFSYITFYKKVLNSLRNYENKYQILCANCNWIKRSENGEYKKLVISK